MAEYVQIYYRTTFILSANKLIVNCFYTELLLLDTYIYVKTNFCILLNFEIKIFIISRILSKKITHNFYIMSDKNLDFKQNRCSFVDRLNYNFMFSSADKISLNILCVSADHNFKLAFFNDIFQISRHDCKVFYV